MRLPTVNPRQRVLEDARQLQEAIWTAHQVGEPYLVAGEPQPRYSDEPKRLHSNLHGFWRSRGYRLSVTLRKDRRMQITLTPASVKARSPQRSERDADLAWTA